MNILEYETYHETKSHSDPMFPCNIYPCTIPLDFLNVPTHWHEEAEIIAVKKGEGVIYVNLIRYEVKQGDLVLIKGGQLHSIEQKEGSSKDRSFSMEYENIIFRIDMLYSKQSDICYHMYFEPWLQQKIVFPVHITDAQPYYSSLYACIQGIDEASELREDAYPLAIKAWLLQLFYILFSKGRGYKIAKYENKSIEKLKIILKYIEENYSKKITIEQSAQLCYYSPSHFMRFFKENMNISFVAYLNDYRLSMAARLLHSSTDSVLSISERTGFENLSYFNRVFKKKYGMTPMQYRKLG